MEVGNSQDFVTLAKVILTEAEAGGTGHTVAIGYQAKEDQSAPGELNHYKCVLLDSQGLGVSVRSQSTND